MRRPITKAYALLISLPIMALLTLLAVSACALLGVDHRANASSLAHAKARFARRAAERIALGELQRLLGPDRRVTADAALLETDAGRAGQPRWCGVWRTDRRKDDPADTPPFIRRDADGALRDDRASRPYDRRAECLRWLVSGRAPDPFAPGDALVRLTPDLKAPAEQLGDAGGFAWAAADLSQKACILAEDTSESGTDNRPAPHAAGADLGLLPGWAADGAGPARAPLTVAGLAAAGRLTPAALEALRGDLTVDSLGVLADSLRGGLREDFSEYLTSAGETRALRDTTPLLEDFSTTAPYRTHGPRLGMLRAWAGLGAAAALTPAAGSRHLVAPGKPADRFHDGTHANLPDVAAPTAPVVAPVLAEAAVYRRLSADFSRRGTGDAPWLRLHLHPRVVLWNPYDRPLAPARYLVHLRVGGSPVFRLVKANRTLTGAISGWRVYANDLVNYATTQGTLLFTLDCPTIPAGQSLLFLPARTAPLYAKTPAAKAYDPLANRLVATTTPSDASFYLEDTDAFEDAGLRALKKVTLDGESWRLENAAAEDFAMGLKLLPAASAQDWKTLRDAPTLRVVSLSVKCGVGTTPAPGWPAGRSEPLRESLDAPPPAGTREGIRLRRFRETAANRAAYPNTNHLETAPLGDGNPLAPVEALHPFAHATPPAGSKDRRAEQFGVFVRDESDPESEPGALAPRPGLAAHPFATPADAPAQPTVVAATLPPPPARVTSFAELSHAPISPFAWHPARVFGESRPSPFAPRDASAHGVAVENFPGLTACGEHLKDLIRFAEAPGALRVCDLRYEANHAVWDRFAFLSGDATRRAAFSLSPRDHPLPNRRVTPGPDFTPGTPVEPAAVLLAGAFNVNSTNRVAWLRLLGSTRGLDPAGQTREPGDPKSRFPRSASAPGALVAGTASPADPNFTCGHRALADAELEKLADALVAEVKTRGPFLGVADFVNRRLTPAPVAGSPGGAGTNACGTLQAAIDAAGLNPVPAGAALPREGALPGTRFIPAHRAPTRHDGLPGLLTQADLLRVIGPALTARGDTFALTLAVLSPDGAVLAREEIIVQRLPEPVHPDPENPTEPDRTRPALGRRLRVFSRRPLD